MGRRSPWGKKALTVTAATLVVAALATARIQVAGAGTGYAGPLLVLDHILDLAVAVALAALCAGAGRRLLHRLRVRFDEPLDELAFATAIGAGAVATGILVLGLAGGIQRPALGLYLLLVTLVSRRELASLPALAEGCIASLARARREDPAIWYFGVAALIAALAYMSVFALAPPVDWDALMYHLRLPAQYVEAGRIYVPEDNLHVAHIGLAHMLYLPLLALGSAAGPAMLNVVLTALLGTAVFSFCSRLLDSRTGSLAMGLLWGTTMILLVASTPRVDGALALYVFLAGYALLLALGNPERIEFLYLAGVLLGLAAGIKYSGLVYGVALAPLALWVVVSRRQPAAIALRTLALFGCAFAAAALPWLVKNWLLLRAPLYPFLAQPALPGWLVPLFGSRTLSPSLHPEIVPSIWDLRAPFNLRDAFIAPGRLTIELEGAYYFLNPAFLILPLWVFFARNRILTWSLIPAILYLFIVLAILPSPNLRYLIPALAPLTIVVAHVAVRASERLLPRRASRLLLVSLACLALTHSASTAATYLRRSTAVEHLLGLSSADRYIGSHIGGSYVETYKFVNASLPADSRILMLFDARGFYFRQQVVQDNDGIGWPLLASVLSPGSCLEPLGITHVMLGIGSLRYYLYAGLDPERVRWRAFLEFADRCLQPVHEESAIVLFEVKPRPPSAASVPGRR